MKILFVTPSPPWPPTTGTNQRTRLVLDALRSCGEVDTVLISRDKAATGENWSVLSEQLGVIGAIDPPPSRDKLWPWKLFRPISINLARRLARNLGRHSAQYSTHLPTYQALSELGNPNSYDLAVGRYLAPCAKAGLTNYRRVIVDLDDLDSEVYRASSEVSGLPEWRRRYIVLRHVNPLLRSTRRVIACLDAAWVTRNHDSQIVREPGVRLLPNIPYARPLGPPPEPVSPGNRRLLTVATMGHPPNVRGVDWFVKEVWPRIKLSEPNARYRIVGSDMTDAQIARWSAIPGIEPVGFVTDLSAEYAQAAFTVAPIHQGGGTKIKVLESLAFGRTVVSTHHSLVGLEEDLRRGESLLAPSDAGFARACLLLLRDRSLRDRLAAHGEKIVRERYSEERFERVIKDTVHDVLARKKGPVSGQS